MTTFLAHLPVERLGWVLIHSLWQFPVIALVIRLLERAFAGRSGASVRYIAGLCGLTAMTAAPVVTWFFIPVTSSASAGQAPGSVGERSKGLRIAPGALPVPTMTDPVSRSLEVMDQPPAEYALADAWSAGWTTLAMRLSPWLPFLVLCWLVGMSFCSLRPFVGWLTLRRLRTVGVSAIGRLPEESARRIAAQLSITQTVSVLRSTLAKTPLVIGYLRPVLLIPVAMVAQLPLAELEAILAHELAHVRRHDFLVNLWQTSLETVFFYHPAVWSLSHRLRAEREYCCDDIALSVVGDPVCYGRALLHVEELRGPEPLLALGAGGGSLRGRILRLFGRPTPPPGAAGLVAGVLLPSVALASVLAAFAWDAPGGNDEKKPAISDLIKQLSDPSQTRRDAAAAELQKSFVVPPRKTWEERVARVQSGMTREEALAAIGIEKREPWATMPNDIAADYRLDEVWVARLWLTRRVTPTTVTQAELVESMQRLWINPPADFTGRWTTYYVNGQKSQAIDYRNGKYGGEFIGYHANGRPNVVQHYSEQHGAHGEDTGHYPSGKLSYRGRYFRGQRIGTWTHYEENGQVRSRERLPVPPEAQDELDEQAEAKPPPKPDPLPAAKPMPAPARAARSLDILIAQHVIVWDGRIRTWDEVVTELREIRKAQGKPIHPNLYFTNGAHSAGHWETYKAKAFEIYKALFEPAGVSFGSISPRAGPRYDVLRKAEDLVPDPKTFRSGVVVEKGQPKAGVLVVLVPEEGLMPVMLKPDLTLRDRHDEVWTVTGPDGRFTLPVQPAHAVDKLTEPPTYALAAISPTGYRLANVPAEGKKATIELLPLARVELTPVGGKQQRIDLSLRGGLPDKSPGFSIYEIDLRDKSLTLPLPVGKITIQRAFLHKDGSSRSYPAETVYIGPGDSRKVKLPNVSEEEAERKWIEESLRPKGNAKKPEGK
jgi:beta-lactamase regulating signal transducer with metallopeptidase domain